MREYYNHRMGSGERARFELHEVTQQVADAFRDLDDQGYFQRAFGYHCVDSGRITGLHGTLEMFFYRRTGIRMHGSCTKFIEEADETRLFTVIEFLYDHAAEPDQKRGWFHDYSGCGWHFNPHGAYFNITAGQDGWREKINNILDLYQDGYELSGDGEIVRLAEDGIQDLVAAPPTAAAGESNVAKITSAVRTFRRGLSSREEQKQAIRQLVDVLEFYRPNVKIELLTEDERDLFNIANNYGIRHHRVDQKDQYSGPWLTWLFYLYLSSVHLVLALVHGVTIGSSIPSLLRPPPNEDSGPPLSEDDIPF